MARQGGKCEAAAAAIHRYLVGLPVINWPTTCETHCPFSYSVSLHHYRQILDKLYRLIDVDSVNLVSTNQIMEFVSNITNARPKSGFDKGALERLEQLFKQTVGEDREIRREDFNKICQSKNVSEGECSLNG